ncbi:MAG: zinc ribbon domain-containing protein [Atopobiaceae bacterium]|jgi:putative FmdB family regulatory protein|nr:zinc ribbon domain-containing protein [Atopobiaceae bacterium]MCH4180625.1 zinc ribbon domain-containing protein [Atopobiaceae bacterium]MCH4214241.1 zinc ribbon domain-containing protein [Atopobiaceae bacterium]MCH4230611.1 zinc ribbon domain-containing protein [Atopobiaceae bacterium]MCH4277198.1 zinc ribbon domain-containing protein [Atopobiaceae bacterium]
MARYDYRCPDCNATFEVEHPMSAHPTVTCPSCGAKAERVFAPSGISLTGSGFYNTDQRGKGSSAHSCASCGSSSCATCGK